MLVVGEQAAVATAVAPVRLSDVPLPFDWNVLRPRQRYRDAGQSTREQPFGALTTSPAPARRHLDRDSSPGEDISFAGRPSPLTTGFHAGGNTTSA